MFILFNFKFLYVFQTKNSLSFPFELIRYELAIVIVIKVYIHFIVGIQFNCLCQAEKKNQSFVVRDQIYLQIECIW